MDTLKCYEILGVTSDDSAPTIRAAYINLAQIWHPDRYPNPVMRGKAEEKMREIEESYQHLASFIPELHGIQEKEPALLPEEEPSVLVDDSHSPVQWTIIFVMLLVFGFVFVIGYHVWKSEHTSITSNAPASNDVPE